MSAIHAVRGRVVTPNSIIVDGAVVIAGDAIVWVGEATEAAAAGYEEEIRAAKAPTEGHYVLPGLVDIHCHGGGGESFPEAPDKEAAMKAVLEHRRHGTTSLVASLVTATPKILREQTELLADLCAAGELAGIHFEGPFLSQCRCGAQNPEAIQTPNPALARELMIASRGYAVTMTIAPEKPYTTGPGSVCEVLIESGALPSFGHTDATSVQMKNALKYGRDELTQAVKPRSRHVTATHLFNGMPPLHHRNPGPILELLADAAAGGVVVELIGDGDHLDPDTVRCVYELIGREQIVFVTDAMAAAGMEDGDYVLGGLAVTVKDGVAKLTGSDAMAGGTKHLLDVVRISAKGGIPLVDAVYCAATNPARVLGDDTLGALEAGRQADLVIASDELAPVRVMRKGQWVD